MFGLLCYISITMLDISSSLFLLTVFLLYLCKKCVNRDCFIFACLILLLFTPYSRKAIHYFVALLPYSLSLLPHLPSDVLLYYSDILGRLVNREEDKDETGLDSISKLMEGDEAKIKKLMEDAKHLGGLST